MKSNFLVELTKDDNVEEIKFKKDTKYFILNLKIDAKTENDLTKWNNYD